MGVKERAVTLAEGTLDNRVTVFLINHPVLTAGIFLIWMALTFSPSAMSFVLAFCLFAMAYNITLGETGIVTFGHAGFLGLGAYGTGLFLVHVDIPEWLGLLSLGAGMGLAMLGGLIIGWFSVRRRGIALALITLAFAQMIYFGAFHWTSVTGGDTGLFGLSTPGLGIPGLGVVSLTNRDILFLVVLALVLASIYIMAKLKETKSGRVFNAIRENEQRAEYLGYNVDRYMLLSFVLSSAFSGLAGGILVLNQGFVSVNAAYWIHSGEVNFFVILGGVQSFLGPVVGAAIYVTLKDWLTVATDIWEIPIGILFILVVIFFEDGIVGTLRAKGEELGILPEEVVDTGTQSTEGDR